MLFQFLGTSAGIPTKERNVTGLAVQPSPSKHWVLIDCGEGTQHRLLHSGFGLLDLETICITHVHGDHCLGLPGLLASNSMFGRKHPITIIAPTDVQQWVTSCLALTDSYLSFDIEWIPLNEQFNGRETKQYRIEAIELSHRVPSHAFKIQHERIESRLKTDKLLRADVPQGPLWGQILRSDSIELPNGDRLMSADFIETQRETVSLIVGGDNDQPDLLRDHCDHVDVLIHEATYSQAISDKVGPTPKHTSATQLAKFAQSVNMPHLIMTHFSSRYGGNKVRELLEEAQESYQGALFLAKDLDLYHLSKGKLNRLSGSAE